MSSLPATDPTEIVRQAGRHWVWILVFGVITAILGVLIAVHPVNTAQAFAIFFGVWLLVAGAFRVVASIADQREPGGIRVLTAFFGILALLFGLLVLHHSFQTVQILGFIIGVFWTVGGTAELANGLSATYEGSRAWAVVGGLLGAAVGVLCLVYPGLSLAILTWLLGVWLIVYGIMQIVVSVQLRKLAHPS